jgi:hypothetical protein
MSMIVLTRISDEKVGINPSVVAWVTPSPESGGAVLFRRDDTEYRPFLVVKETFEEVLDLLGEAASA